MVVSMLADSVADVAQGVRCQSRQVEGREGKLAQINIRRGKSASRRRARLVE